MTHTSTYDPADNKLRFYPACRLSPEEYERVKKAGFGWAPKQGLFVAPAWTPAREDLLLELCGEIEDEDKSLVERAEERAERFEEFSGKRASEAESVERSVSALADGIPFGQPILVGHHSQRRAEKDAEKITSGMKKTLRLWETSAYWQERAKGALRHAKYKELPDVRYRRIKTLESEIRTMRAAFTPDPNYKPIMRQRSGDSSIDGEKVEHVYVGPKGRGGYYVPTASLPAIEAHYSRWIAHTENRIAYERAMLGEQGGVITDKAELVVGGTVRVGSTWYTILRVNKSCGVVASVKTARKYGSNVSVEEIAEYREPEPGVVEKIKAASKLPPLVNFKGEGFIEMTKREYDSWYLQRSAWTVKVEAAEEHGAYRQRVRGHRRFIFITDMPVKLPPGPESSPEVEVPPLVEYDASLVASRQPRTISEAERKIEQLQEAVRTGVTAVSAPSLFPTPKALAERLVDEAGIAGGMTILEPSAGTGAILEAILNVVPRHIAKVTAVEIDCRLASALGSRFETVSVHRGDFLEFETDTLFDRVIMNPPFECQADIRHIEKARTLLAPQGRLVAICAAGPRQTAWAKQNASWFEELPANSFAESGTSVSTLLVCVEAP